MLRFSSHLDVFEGLPQTSYKCAGPYYDLSTLQDRASKTHGSTVYKKYDYTLGSSQ